MPGSTVLLTMPPLELLFRAEQQHLNWTEDCHQLFLYDCFVRGFRHHYGTALLPRMKEMDTLHLVREYENEHDDFAVAVYWEGQKVGSCHNRVNMIFEPWRSLPYPFAEASSGSFE